MDRQSTLDGTIAAIQGLQRSVDLLAQQLAPRSVVQALPAATTSAPDDSQMLILLQQQSTGPSPADQLT